MFTFKDSGDTSDACLSVEVRGDGCVISADPKNKKVSEQIVLNMAWQPAYIL